MLSWQDYLIGKLSPITRDLKQAAFVPPATSFVYMPGFGKTPGSVISVTAGQTGPGDPVALGRLGLLYRDGLGVRPDPARAEALLLRQGAWGNDGRRSGDT